ncbi:MAG: hypothetical protein K8H85_09665 [Cyclobacteriaceae bacterium]|nr:hypothetical protein [Cyclobacteriaceae bacterium]
MTRDLRLKFCLLCVNRQFDRDKGVICRLTNAQADFIEDCKDLKIDNSEFKRISVEKIYKFGITDKKGFFKELVKESDIDYHLTTKFSLVKPREQKDLGSETHIQKSKVLYGLLTLVPIAFFTVLLFQTKSIGYSLLIIGALITCLIAVGWILVDYFINKNDFIINDRGFKIKEQFIPWKIILGTMIKIERFKNFNNKYLVLIVATTNDIEIKLNGLTGMTESIENIVELYKERFRASNKNPD